MITFTPGYFGWLGNQMFQYAAVASLAKEIGASFGFPKNTPNLFDVFNLTAEKDPAPSMYLYKEEGFHYHPLPETSEDVTLFGYFQSEKYFSKHKDFIKKEFTFKKQLTDAPSGKISLHVRRGDYLNLQEHHPPCTMSYYNKAMDLFPGGQFLVFSDDIDWCKRNFKGKNVEFSMGESAEDDLQLMSKCDHHIMANSSFSWWGAWLGNNKDKRVVAPKQWFGPAKRGYDTKDLYCEDWIVL